MNTSIKFFSFLVLFTFITVSSFAGNVINESKTDSNFNVSFLDQSSNRVVVNFANNDSNPIHLSILDENGTLLHNENIQGNGVFSKRFSFSELNNGTYALQIEKSGSKYVHAVILK